MLENISFEITAADLALGRLDKIIAARHPTTTRALVSEAFAQGGVFCCGTPERRKGAPPRRGAVITLPRLGEAGDAAAAPDGGALRVVYEDALFIGFDKPHGQPCHPVRPGETGALANAIAARFPALAGVGGAPSMPGMLHRIDGGTSGLVLCAKTEAAYRAVRAQFAARAVVKTYEAAVEGAVRAAGGVSGRLAHCTSFRGRMRAAGSAALPGGERAMFAETFYEPLAPWQGGDPATRATPATLLRVRIMTGVTHQIRCQLASIGHPVVGDALYGAAAMEGRGGWHMLRSCKMEFTHPGTGERAVIDAGGLEAEARAL